MRWPADEPFWIGVNLPWLSYGGDFGANRWQPAGGIGQPGRRAALREALGRLADSGATRVRWFMLADGRAGLLESASGDVAGLDDHVFRDADAALDELERAGLKAIFVLFDYHWFKRGRIVDGVRTGGRRALAIDPTLRRRLIDLVVDPLLVHCGRHPVDQRLGRYQRAGVGHQGHAAAPSPVRCAQGGHAGVHPRRRRRRPPADLPRRDRRQRVNADACRLSRASAWTSIRRIGTTASRSGPRSSRAVASLGLDRPLILGEFPTRGSRRSPAEILEAARQAGYAGALAWSALADDEASGGSALAAGLSDFTADTAVNRARP